MLPESRSGSCNHTIFRSEQRLTYNFEDDRACHGILHNPSSTATNCRGRETAWGEDGVSMRSALESSGREEEGNIFGHWIRIGDSSVRHLQVQATSVCASARQSVTAGRSASAPTGRSTSTSTSTSTSAPLVRRKKKKTKELKERAHSRREEEMKKDIAFSS